MDNLEKFGVVELEEEELGGTEGGRFILWPLGLKFSFKTAIFANDFAEGFTESASECEC